MIDETFPLIDLHRHLDGNVRLETLLELGQKHNLSLPADTLEGLRPFVQVTAPQPGLLAFLDKFYWLTAMLADYDACRQIAYENVEDACREGLSYIELRFSPWFMASAHQLDPAGVVEAVCDGIAAGQRDFGLRTNLIGILSRTYGPEICAQELDVLLQYRDCMVALDLAGDEGSQPAENFIPHFRKARDAGWKVTAHAGEAAGPESIWVSLRELGASRIGHAVHAVDDPALIDYMAEQRTGIEANLTSNVQTSTVPDYASHPMRFFLEHGLLATINSDDPSISGIDLVYEYRVAAPKAGLSRAQTMQAQRNALEVAFLSAEEKEALVQQAAGRAGQDPNCKVNPAQQRRALRG